MLLSLLQGLARSQNATVIIAGFCLTLLSLFIGFVATIVITGPEFSLRRKLRHLRQLGLSDSNSNMSDQYDRRFDGSESDSLRVKALFIHPIKSCGPVEVHRAMLTKTGLLYDRLFAIASPSPEPETKKISWRFISQRTKPAMSLIKTEIWLPCSGSYPDDALVRSGGCVVVRFPDPDSPSWRVTLETFVFKMRTCTSPHVSFILPLDPAAVHLSDSASHMTPRPFAIHSRTAYGVDMGSIPSVAEILPKLKRFLGLAGSRDLTLFKCTPDTFVRTTQNLAPLENIGSPAVHGYTDQQPININSLSSVQALSEMIPLENRPLNALRFRANIWITGAPPYDEETWKRCRVIPKADDAGPRAKVDAVLSVVCRTSRCTIPNVDPAKGTFDTDLPLAGRKKGKPQPSTAMLECRMPEDGNKSALGYLGMHCVPEDRSLDQGQKREADLYVEVGDEIEVVERGVHLFGSTGNDY